MSSASPSTPRRRVRAGHAHRPQQLAISVPSPAMPAAVAMKRESSLESTVSSSRTRVTKKLKTGAQRDATSATIHLYLPYPAEHVAGKLVSDSVVPSVSQPKRKRNGHFKLETIDTCNITLPSDASDGGNSSGDEADDEIDVGSVSSRRTRRSSRSSNASPATDVEDAGADMTDVDEDEGETQHVEMSIVDHIAPMTPASSTTGGFPVSQNFPWFASAPVTPSSARQAPQESPLHQVESLLSVVRQRNGFTSTSSSDGSDWETTNSHRASQRTRAVERNEDASEIEEAMMAESDGHQTPSKTRDCDQAVQRYEASSGQRILIATVSGVTAGLQALPPLHRALSKAGSDAEMQSFASLTDTDGYDTDVIMRVAKGHESDIQMASVLADNEPLMTLDQFTAYRSQRIKSTGIRLTSHELVQTSRLRGQNIQECLFKLGYTLPIPLVRSIARKRRCLRVPRTTAYKPVTRLTGNLREDLLVRAFAKYRRDALKVYNRTFALTAEQAAQLLDTWGTAHRDHGFRANSETMNEELEMTQTSANECRALVPYRPTSPERAETGNPFVRTHSQRIESYEPLYPEATVRYTRALLSMLRDRYPAWDRWWSDERRYASHRATWADYDAETVRMEYEARQVQDSLTSRRRIAVRNERMGRLGFGGVAIAQGMPTRMDRDEQDLIEQALLEARIQRFRALVNSAPVRAPLAITIPAATSTAVIPSSPPPAYHSQSPQMAARTSAAVVASIEGATGHGEVADGVVITGPAVMASPPRLPAYQPSTYRRGISPPPPPPFNARTDAIPIRDMPQALELSTRRTSGGRRLAFEHRENRVTLPGSFTSAHIMEHFEETFEAPVAVRPRAHDALLSQPISNTPAPAPASPIFSDEDDEGAEEELDDLLGEVEEEDIQEQAQAAEPRGSPLGCNIM